MKRIKKLIILMLLFFITNVYADNVLNTCKYTYNEGDKLALGSNINYFEFRVLQDPNNSSLITKELHINGGPNVLINNTFEFNGKDYSVSSIILKVNSSACPGDLLLVSEYGIAEVDRFIGEEKTASYKRDTTTITTTIRSKTTTVKTASEGNMSEMLDVCESSGPLQLIYAAKIIFAFICYSVPLLIAIMLTIDISKVATDPTQVKKIFDVAKKRLLIGLLLLFTPTLVKILINSLGSDSDLQKCYNNANTAYIKARKDYEKEYFNSQRETKKTGKHITRSIIGTPLNISSGWKEKTENSKGTFGNYLYVPENVTSNTPLVLILPGDNNGADYNWSSKIIRDYFDANYGSGKNLNYSTTFILIPKLNYSSLGSGDKAHQTGVALDNIFNSSSPIFDNVTLADLKIDRSRVSIVGFSTGASYMFTYTNLHRDYFSAMYVISNGGGVSGLGSDLDYYRKMPMMGAAEGEGSRVYASNTKAIFYALGKSGYYTEAAGYTHDQMHEYVFSRDTNRDGYNDSLEWLINQGGSGSTLPFTTTSNELWWPIGSQDTQTVNGVLYAYKSPVPSSITLDFSIADEVHPGGHDGIDIGVEKGIYLIAIGNGTIVEGTSQYFDHGRISYAELKCGDASRPEYYKYANYINIKLDNGLIVKYGHIMKDSIPASLRNSDGTAKIGARVNKGQVIAQVGVTGCTSGPHVHFTITEGSTAKDPKLYVKKNDPRPGLES